MYNNDKLRKLLGYQLLSYKKENWKILRWRVPIVIIKNNKNIKQGNTQY